MLLRMITDVFLVFTFVVRTSCFSGAISTLAGRISTVTQALRRLYAEHLSHAAPSQLYMVQVSGLKICFVSAPCVPCALVRVCVACAGVHTLVAVSQAVLAV